MGARTILTLGERFHLAALALTGAHGLRLSGWGGSPRFESDLSFEL
jgi:hypothetical protein